MDRLDAMRLFIRVVERRSFTLAARDIGVPRSTATDAVKALEARLRVRLLQRTTRHVAPTLDGEAYYRRCIGIIADVEDAEGAFAGLKPGGLLRVEVQGTLARHFLLPGLPDFLERYPAIELAMSEGERWVDVVREGVDCVLRYGNLPDSDMVGRRLIMLDRLTCAAPAYLARHGMPTGIDALEGHRMIGLRSLSTGNLWPLEFMIDGAIRTVDMPAIVSVTGTESYLAAARLGLGLFQVPRFHAGADLPEGRLLPLLVETPPPSVPVSILWPRNRQLSPRVRVFVDWAVEQFARAQL
ncbi:LysR family transcriptional regulator [Sphingomonas colocasiae]|uniref:LysR family transcriptional regulator n=1 Tax=Sphingomonas colocasiae TaxID=1848973 RepID=A0ABS7Q051_9SPHN|nr:LysR family transcriptional regulator [Sphingomonas colocasiae]MBY8825947.1 LysR family transcriptional regulator [Sphingomonas colocasiae]